MTRKTAIVTGASSGIGLAIAKTLLAKKDDYVVIAAARNMTASKTLAPSETCILIDGDISKKATGERLVEAAIKKTGRIDLLVNNAGIFTPGNFQDYTEEQYRSTMSTNVDGFFYTTQPVIRQMLKQKSGHVVSISTTLADQPVMGVNAFATYCSKGAINAVTKSLAIEYAQAGIRFNAIGAGIINTSMHKPENHDFLKNLHPIARLGTVEEIADALLYLESAKFVTGEILHVDGGARG